jgi:hypothetical protein
MRRSSRRAAPLAALALLAAAPAQPQAPPAAPVLARLAYVERRVEQASAQGASRLAAENAALRFGESLQTGADAMARLEFGWMALTLSPASAVAFPDELVLSARLREGRAAVHAPQREALKLVTAEAEMRGRGQAAVRREGQGTRVTCFEGRFTVEAQGQVVTVETGQGTVVLPDQPPTAARPLLPAPLGLVPGADPLYVAVHQPVTLRWNGAAGRYSVEILPVGKDVVLLQRDVAEARLDVALPWPGAFRWRVAALDGQGLEGRRSAFGQIVVDDP